MTFPSASAVFFIYLEPHQNLMVSVFGPFSVQHLGKSAHQPTNIINIIIFFSFYLGWVIWSLDTITVHAENSNYL